MSTNNQLVQQLMDNQQTINDLYELRDVLEQALDARETQLALTSIDLKPLAQYTAGGQTPSILTIQKTLKIRFHTAALLQDWLEANPQP